MILLEFGNEVYKFILEVGLANQSVASTLFKCLLSQLEIKL